MSMLERKLTRDLWRLKGQVATIALVLACGIMAMVMLRSTWSSLIAARDAYYEQYRFGDLFAHLERAPDTVAARLESIPGVARAYPRLVEDIMVPLAEEPDPVTGRIVSLPDDGVPPLDGLYLRSGRLPTPGAEDEAVVLEQFALAHALVPGDSLPAVIEGHLRQIRIVGIALSPEFVIAMSSAAPIADNRRFVVLWMLRREIAPAFRMEGAFNDIVLQLEPHAQPASVLEEVDRELVRYGGRHAVTRAKQPSNYALISELSVLKTVALIVPTVFLLVAAFLVNVVISRLVFLERTQIAVLKALGFSNRRVGVHYLGLVALIVGIASVVGVAFGVWAGRWMTNLYSEFYKFPHSLFHVAPGVVAYTIAIGLGAATVGALASVLRVTRMAPAQAMRPPAPLSYRRALVDRLGLARIVGASGTMVVREIQRRPLRTAMSIAGIAMGVGIYIMGTFSRDSFDHLFDVAYSREHQEDMTVMFSHPRPDRAVRELEHLPGVRIAEPQHTVPVRFRSGPRWRDSVIFGLAAPGQLRHLLEYDITPIEIAAAHALRISVITSIDWPVCSR